MHPFFEKLFWKTWLRKKRKAWKIFFYEKKRFFTRKRLYAYLFWELTKKAKHPRKFRFKNFIPKISYRKIRFISKSQKKPWWFTSGIAVSLLLVLATPLFLFGYPMLKEYKVHRFQKTARAALENNETYTALQTSLAAELALPGDLANLRILVKAAAQSNHPRLIEWRRKLANHAYSSPEEREDYLKLLLSLGAQGEAEQWFRSLPQAIEKQESIYLQCLILAQNEEEGIAQAFSLVNDFLQENPTATPLCEFFWDLCIRSQQVFFWEEGLRQMRQAAEMDGKHARGAIRRLLKMKIGTIDERKVWANKLWKYPSPSMEDAILCMNASFGENRINGTNLVRVLQQDFPELTLPENKLQLAQLLNRVGRPDSAREILADETLKAAEKKKAYLLTIVTALSEEQDPMAYELINETTPVLSPNEIHFFELLLGNLLDKKDHASPEELASNLAHCTPEDLQTIRLFLRFAESPDFVIAFLEELAKRNPQRTGIKYLLTNSYQRTGKFTKLENLLSTLSLPERVGNVSGERQTCILKSFYGQDPDDCLRWAEDAFASNPQNLATRYALALCYLKMGETNQAFSLLAPFLNAPPPLCPTQQLIGALTLHRSNRTKQALAWSPVRHRSLLIDAERELLSEIHRSTP
jgi:tetratricopeptide (TPR) repeat protein